MPLWDSVHRSLEKASHEAARIAKAQRLRNIIDGLNRQINTQHSSIVNKAMDMFIAGQLTTGELYQLCQEMMNLQQQLNQARNELQQIQIQAPTPPSQMAEGQGGTVVRSRVCTSCSRMCQLGGWRRGAEMATPARTAQAVLEWGKSPERRTLPDPRNLARRAAHLFSNNLGMSY